jgi:transposase
MMPPPARPTPRHGLGAADRNSGESVVVSRLRTRRREAAKALEGPRQRLRDAIARRQRRRLLQRNKTDARDAETLAQLVRTGWYREARVKGWAAHAVRHLVNARAQLVGV